MSSVSRAEKAFLAVFAACSAWLLLGGLGVRPLWMDEAETGLVGLSVLRHGIPMADGFERFYGPAVAHFNSSGVWTWHPWLQFYMTAAGLGLFGKSAEGARALFAMTGLLTLAATWRLGRGWLGPLGGALAAVFLAASSTFLVYARECRWYAPAMLFTVLTVDAARRLERKPGRRSAAWLGAALAGLFHSNYLDFAAVGFGLALRWLWLLRRGRRPPVRAGGLSLAIAGALTVPWLVFVRPASFGMVHPGASWSFLHSGMFEAYLIQYNHFVCPFVLAAVPLALAVRGRKLREPGTWGLAAAVTVSLFLATSLSPVSFFRYSSPALPLGALLMAGAVVEASAAWRPAVVLLPGLLLLTQLLQNAPYLLVMRAAEQRVLQPPLADFLQERLVPTPTLSDCVTTWFERRSRPGQSVLILDTGLALKFHCGLEVEDPAVTGRVFPADWIVETAPFRLESRASIRLPEPLLKAGVYRRYSLVCPGGGILDSAPEPAAHSFGWEPRPPKVIRLYEKRS
jgi:4-amino-4-deoxy-L-arabinose transferase-like glycosyltransferase